jgi:hypothetical protein
VTWSGLTRRARPHAWPAALGLGLGLLALGPAVGRGFVLSYDMVFVPSPPIGLADLGVTGGGPARAVPSDLIVALAARVIPAQFAEKLILILIFVVACSGAAALLAARWPGGLGRLGLLARLAAGVLYAWNPFVAERLIMGQWAMLLGYAGLPWVVRELSARDRVRLGWLLAALVPAAIGGFAAMSITAITALPVALCAGTGLRGGATWPDRARRVGLTLAVIVVASLPWIIPSFLTALHADPNGATAFAARADTPFGTIGSLLMLGGIWNAQAVPSGYGGGPVSVAWLAVAVIGIAGYVLAARPRLVCSGLGLAAGAGFCVAGIGAWAPTLTLLRDAIAFWPAFALLRDGQQFIAPLALAESIGLGAGVFAVLSASQAKAGAHPDADANSVAKTATAHQTGPGRGEPAGGSTTTQQTGPGRGQPAGGVAAVVGVLALLAPVLLLPGLAWGAFGRLRPVEYPADWLTARQVIDSGAAPGSVLLLPWAQYRTYPWNHGEPVFDPWPRLLSRPMIWNDALRVGSVTVAAESPAARRLTPAISSGRPLTATLLSAGVRYVIIDAGPLLGDAARRLASLPGLARLPGSQVVLASSDLIVLKLPAAPPGPRPR